MAAVTVTPPYQQFLDSDGTALENGYIYIGTAGLDPATNQIQAYFDSALTTPATQPIRTVNGFYSNNGSPADIFVNASDYSITVQDSTQSLVFTKLNYNTELPLSSFEYTKSATGAVSRDFTSILDDVVSVKDFGAVGDGVTDDSSAFTLAEAADEDYIFIPEGTYIVSGVTLNNTYYGPGVIELNSVVQDVWFDELNRALKTEDDFFSDSGTANAYVLTKVNGSQITSYEDGMRAIFVADNVGTGGATTVNIDGVGSSNIVRPDGTALQAGDIAIDRYNHIVYDLLNTRWNLDFCDSVLKENIFPSESQATNGYIELKGGLLIQWGVNAGSTGGSTHSYPTAFSSGSYSLVGSSENQGSPGWVIDIRMDQVSATQFTITTESGTPQISWIAIGV